MKMWNYLVMCLFLALFFQLAGMPIAASLLEQVGIDIEGAGFIQDSLLYLAIFGTAGILIGLGAGIIVGIITRSNPENYVILPFIIGQAVLFFATFTGIIQYSFNNFPGWIAYITLLIMAPLAIGFIIAAYEHFRGTD